MTMLESIDFNPELCHAEAKEFQGLLAAKKSLKERDDILPFFKSRKQLSAGLGLSNGKVWKIDRVAHEYPLFGNFVCDLVVGDWTRRSYVFCEFEDAAPNSIFKLGKRRTMEWAPRFEHGFSQLVDWFFEMQTQGQTSDFEQRFGSRTEFKAIGMLVIGRRENLGPREKERLNWRLEHWVNASSSTWWMLGHASRDSNAKNDPR